VFDAGEQWTYTASYTVTQDDLLGNGNNVEGAITNTVTVDTAQTTPISTTASIVVRPQPPVLQIAKAADVTSVDAAGDMIQYTIKVTNTGTSTLTSLLVTDPQITHSVPIVDPFAPILSTTQGLSVPKLNGDYNVGDTNQNGVQDPGETFVFVNQ